MKFFKKLMAIMLVAGVMVCGNGMVSAKAEENMRESDIESRMVDPYYDVSESKAFFVGNTRVDSFFYISDNKGGVEYAAADYCDFYMEGYVQTVWGDKFDLPHTRSEIRSTEFSAYDYVVCQPVYYLIVEDATICALGDTDYEKSYSAELQYIGDFYFNWK